jgi:hypothetical protein
MFLLGKIKDIKGGSVASCIYINWNRNEFGYVSMSWEVSVFQMAVGKLDLMPKYLHVDRTR